MGVRTKIQWSHSTFNCWRGCAKVSPGCEHCYAWAGAKRNPKVLGRWGVHGTRVVAAAAQWRDVIRWNQEAEAAGERRRVFCCSLADVLEQWDGPMLDSQERRLWVEKGTGEWIADDGSQDFAYRKRHLTMADVLGRLLCWIHRTPGLDYLLVTKRPELWRARMQAVEALGGDAGALATQWLNGSPMPNIWMGATVEDQERADERILHLLKIPATVRFLSVEPLLGPVNLGLVGTLPKSDFHGYQLTCDRLHWVIVGGESGHNARPCDLAWIRSIVSECRDCKVAVFVKQLGARPVGVWGQEAPQPAGSKHRPTDPVRWHLEDSHGGNIDEFPRGLKIRELPEVARG